MSSLPRFTDHTYHDYSTFIKDGGVIKKHKKSERNFPARLHAMLSNEQYSHIITWMVSIEHIWFIFWPNPTFISHSLLIYVLSLRIYSHMAVHGRCLIRSYSWKKSSRYTSVNPSLLLSRDSCRDGDSKDYIRRVKVNPYDSATNLLFITPSLLLNSPSNVTSSFMPLSHA